MDKKTWLSLEGKFRERERALSTVLCDCGCGGFISGRAAREKANGKKNGGYIRGHFWRGQKHSEESIIRMSETRADGRYKGKNNPNYGRRVFGKDNPNWQGGKKSLYVKNNPPNSGIKKDRLFRKQIKLRDKQCILCGNISHLHTHHIEPWMEREDLRFESKNCVVLCWHCHTRADNAHHKERIKPMLLAYIESIYDV